MSDSAIHAAAGAAGGIVAMTATYPLIFLSTRAAVETKNETRTAYQAVVDIIQREGVLGLYSGLNSSLLGIAITNGFVTCFVISHMGTKFLLHARVYYYFYERSRGIILRSRVGGKALSTLESVLTGMIAGSATTVISNPVWVVQTSQAVRTMSADGSPQTVKKLSFLETVQNILKNDGVGAFWRGIGPALVLVVNPVLQYTVFEQLKNYLIARRTRRLRALGGAATAVSALTDWDFFVLGALSKLVATSVTYPYIVIKSRLHAGSSVALKYKSSFDGVLTILREEGVAGLYKGIESKIVQSVLTAAILFAGQRRIYEAIKKKLPLLKAISNATLRV
ncbi:peroxisomal membrane protein [Cyathus striatus]|nr:peroxisomal membrane protein [Cyathus striatus]